MKFRNLLLILIIIFFYFNSNYSQSIIADHNCTDLKAIPQSAILSAKQTLHIAYGHTSHGSQLITGMNNLDSFMGDNGIYTWHDGPLENNLDIDDYFVSGDLGNPDRTTWANRTREYLNHSNNKDVNVVIWSWCGQVSSATEGNITTYLELMNQLENEFPSVSFVYMTGHLDGSGLNGNLHLRNEQIRNYCRTNNKILYDFADIECYNPDGLYFGDKMPNDNCDYDSDGNGSRDANWAVEWQNSHIENQDWYGCSSAHSQALNANQKAYAAWWLWATLAGWVETTSIDNENNIPQKIKLENNFPNPFNPETNISFYLPQNKKVNIEIFDILGNKIKSLSNRNYPSGYHTIIWKGLNDFGLEVNSGIYICRMKSGNFIKSQRMILLK